MFCKNDHNHNNNDNNNTRPGLPRPDPNGMTTPVVCGSPVPTINNNNNKRRCPPSPPRKLHPFKRVYTAARCPSPQKSSAMSEAEKPDSLDQMMVDAAKGLLSLAGVPQATSASSPTPLPVTRVSAIAKRHSTHTAQARQQQQQSRRSVTLVTPDRSTERYVLSTRLFNYLEHGDPPALVWTVRRAEAGTGGIAGETHRTLMSWQTARIFCSRSTPGDKTDDIRFLWLRMPGYADAISASHTAIVRMEWLRHQLEVIRQCIDRLRRLAVKSDCFPLDKSLNDWINLLLSNGEEEGELQQQQQQQQQQLPRSSVFAISVRQVLRNVFVMAKNSDHSAVSNNDTGGGCSSCIELKRKSSLNENTALPTLESGEGAWPGKPNSAKAMARDLLPLWLMALREKQFVQIPNRLTRHPDFLDRELQPRLVVPSPITLSTFADRIIVDHWRFRFHKLTFADFLSMLFHLSMLMSRKFEILKNTIPHTLRVLVNKGFRDEIVKTASHLQHFLHNHMARQQQQHFAPGNGKHDENL